LRWFEGIVLRIGGITKNWYLGLLKSFGGDKTGKGSANFHLFIHLGLFEFEESLINENKHLNKDVKLYISIKVFPEVFLKKYFFDRFKEVESFSSFICAIFKV
jgi:hypothetical protein